MNERQPTQPRRNQSHGQPIYHGPLRAPAPPPGLGNPHVPPRPHLSASQPPSQGILRYRGYPIEELAESSTYLETAYLVIYGSLPSPKQLSDFESAVILHNAIPEGVQQAIDALPHDAHPMSVLLTGLSALGGVHPEANPAIMGQGVYSDAMVCRRRTRQQTCARAPRPSGCAGKAIPAFQGLPGHSPARLPAPLALLPAGPRQADCPPHREDLRPRRLRLPQAHGAAPARPGTACGPPPRGALLVRPLSTPDFPQESTSYSSSSSSGDDRAASPRSPGPT